MRPLTDHCPKPLLEVSGRPLIELALDQTRYAQISRVVINTHYLAEQLEHYFREYIHPEVILSHEDTILETGGGVLNALPVIKRPAFFTLNSDAFWSNQTALTTLQAHWDAHCMDALLLLVKKEHTHSYTRSGDFHLLEEGKLRRRDTQEKAPYVYTGAQIIKSSAFSEGLQGAFSLNLVWEDLITAGRCYGCVYDGTWGDIGTPTGLSYAQNQLLPQKV